MEQMSDYKVEVVKIDEILIHPEADRLELARIKGWQCVVGKGQYKAGNKIVYIPIDSVLPPWIEEKLFPPDSKIKLHKSRVKTIRIRKAVSQGMVTPLEKLDLSADLAEGTDVTEKLQIKKYEPPIPEFQKGLTQAGPAKKSYKNPSFHVYSKHPNIKNYPELFKDEDEVIVTEKIHGTNFRAGWVPFHANTLWRKFLQLVGLAPKWQFVYGSHNVQISEKFLYKGFYDSNVYAEAVHKYNLQNLLKKGDVIYGEIYGQSIQKGYLYGCTKPQERNLAVFDIMRNGQYLSDKEYWEAVQEYKLPFAPVLYKGKMKDLKLEELRDGPSVLYSKQLIREGCVIKSVIEEMTYAGRKCVKCVSPAYLEGDQTDYH